MEQRWENPADVGQDDAFGAVATEPELNLRAEFGAHLEAHYSRLVAQLCLITLDPAEAQDLVQEAYARAWQRWADIRELASPTGWIRQTAVRGSRRKWRRLVSRLGSRRSQPGPGAVPTDDAQHRTTLAALAQISPHRRRVLVLADVAHLAEPEVAEVEGIAAEVARARLVEARNELMSALSAGLDTQPPAVSWEDM